jgi:ribonuclease HI
MALLATVGSVQLLNCARGLATTISALQDFARKNENLILLLQEPWTDRHGHPPVLPEFDTFTPIPLKPKCVTYVRRTPGLTATTIFTAQDSFLGTTITSTQNSKTTTFTLLNFYSPGRAEPIARLLPTIPVPKECILMGDLNAHHVWWQGPLPQTARTSPASHSLAEWLESNNFQLHNVPGLPTHHPRNGSTPSTIDLCLSRGNISASILSLATDHDTTSDHSSITVTLALPSAISPAPIRRNWHKANWETFSKYVQSTGLDLSNLQGKEDTLRAVTNVTTILNDAIDAAVPSGVSRKPEAPWWNHSLTLAKRSVKRADKRTRLYPSAANQEDRHQKRQHWTAMVRAAKTAYRIKQLQSADTKNIWKTIRHHNTHQRPIPPLEGQTDFKGKCASLRNALFPAVNNLPRQPLPPLFLTSKFDMYQQTRPVTTREVSLAITQLKYGTSVGPDGISYTTLRHLHESAPRILPLLFDACLTHAVHPPEWKVANCVVVPKPGKSSYTHPKSYRPISLQSCFGKLLESIVAKRLTSAALRCGATHPSQMGAQPENSAVDALLRTITPIATAISKKKKPKKDVPRPAVLTHDIEGAFNQVHPSTLREVMHQRRMPTYLTNWVSAFNTDRKIAFGFDQQSEDPQPYQCGLPQGSPISPILFLIFSNAMLEKQDDPTAVDTSYVDDVCMVQMSYSIAEANTLLEDRTEQYLHRGLHLGLSFAPSKSELLYCLPLNSKHKNISLSSHPPLRVMNTTIMPKRQIKYLGVYIDESLSFLHHASMAASQGNRVLSSLNFLRHRSRGVPAHVAHHLALAAVLPAMFWASPAWWTGTPMLTSTLKLTYNAIARWITGLPYNTRISNLLTLAHLPPMEAYLDYLSLRFAIRLHFLPAHHALGRPCEDPTTHSHLPGLHRLHDLSKHLIRGMLEDRTTASTADGIPRITSPNPDKTTSPQELHGKWIHSLPDHTVVIYTDGSKLDSGSTGCGWVIFNVGNQQLYRIKEGSCHLGNRAEVFDAELHAVQEATAALLTSTIPRSTAFICIDNQAAINTLQFNKDNHEYARRTLETVAQLRLLGWTMSTVWCPSHCGLMGNEHADSLAKMGTSLPTPCQYSRTTKVWLQTQARAQLLRRWKQELPLSNPSFTFPSHLQGVDWADTRALWRVFCNRSPSDPHPNQTADPCPCGQDLHTSHHLLRDCKLLVTQRSKLQRSTTGDIQSLTFLTNPANWVGLRNFLRDTGLGHITNISYDRQPIQLSEDASDSDSPEPDFGVFEP